MDDKLENFVGLLNRCRQPRPVSDEYPHLPEWARRALAELPEPSRGAKSAPAPALAAIEIKAEPLARVAMGGDVLEAERDEPPPPPPLVPSYRVLPEDDDELLAAVSPFSDFAALLAAAEAAPAPERVLDSMRALDAVAPAPALVEAVADRPKARLVPVLAPLLAVAVVAVGGGLWYQHQASGTQLASSPHAAVRQANTAPLVTPPAHLAEAAVPSPAVAAKPAPGAVPAGKMTAAAVPAKPSAAPVKPATVVAAVPAAKPAAPPMVAAKPAPPMVAAKPAPPTVAAKPAVSKAVSKIAAVAPPAVAPTPPGKISGDTQIAMLTPPVLSPLVLSPPAAAPVPAPPPPAVPGAPEPAWLRYAMPAPPFTGAPRVAIVIDDLGIDKRRTARAIALNGPVTLSFLAYASDLARQTEAARRAGHELIVHVPMEPVIQPKYLGRNGGAPGLARDEVLRQLKWDLSRFTGYVGVNNHMGSELSGDPGIARTVMAVLKQRGLLFLDPMSGNGGGVFEVAASLGVPTATRDILLDDDVGAPAISARLTALEKMARARGTAIAIGHPHDGTLDALTAWLATLKQQGLQLVPLTAIVKQREAHAVRVN